MRFKMLLLLVPVFLVQPAIALADDKAAAVPKPEKKICRREETTGSILGARPICHTKAEWAKLDSANGRAADDMLQRGRDLQNSGAGNTRN